MFMDFREPLTQNWALIYWLQSRTLHHDVTVSRPLEYFANIKHRDEYFQSTHISREELANVSEDHHLCHKTGKSGHWLWCPLDRWENAQTLGDQVKVTGSHLETWLETVSRRGQVRAMLEELEGNWSIG